MVKFRLLVGTHAVSADLLARTRRPEAAPAAHCKAPRARTELRRTLCSDIGFYEDTDTCIGVPHFLATQYLRTKGIKPQFPNGIVSSVSFVSTTNTARSLAGFVLLALALRCGGRRAARRSSVRPCRSSPVRR